MKNSPRICRFADCCVEYGKSASECSCTKRGSPKVGVLGIPCIFCTVDLEIVAFSAYAGILRISKLSVFNADDGFIQKTIDPKVYSITRKLNRAR